MPSYTQAGRAPQRQFAQDGAAQLRTDSRGAGPDAATASRGALDEQLNGSPRAQSLLQMRRALDAGMQSQLALHHAMNRPAAGSAPAQRKPNATGLPDHLKTGVEQLSGLSLDDVRVHYNSSKPAAMQAHAYAQGADIHVAPGQEKHLPHEAWHVVQQKQGRVKPTLQLKGVAINDDFEFEAEADVMGGRAMQLRADAAGAGRLRSAGPSGSKPTVLQPRLVIGDTGYLRPEAVINLLANDDKIGWDDRWDAGLRAIIQSRKVFEFADSKAFEMFMMNGIFPLAGVDQPSNRDDKERGRLCFVYAALSAANITGDVADEHLADMERHLVGQNKYSMGGGASTAFRQMDMAPREIVIRNTDNYGVPAGLAGGAADAPRLIAEGLENNLPLTVGVRWQRGGKSGNHWVYIVGISGNKVHVRDQQNGHVLGTIDMSSWKGKSIDGTTSYVVTKVARAQQHQAGKAKAAKDNNTASSGYGTAAVKSQADSGKKQE